MQTLRSNGQQATQRNKKGNPLDTTRARGHRGTNRIKNNRFAGSRANTRGLLSAQEQADCLGKIAAINKSQAAIEFELDGTIVTANDNFLNALGYSLAEVQGRHHSMFVDEATRQSAEYKEFWAKL